MSLRVFADLCVSLQVLECPGISQRILADLCGSCQVTGVLMGLSGSWWLSLGLGRSRWVLAGFGGSL